MSDLNFIRVSDISIPECVFYPYKSENQKLDNIFSEDGGIVPSQSILLTGMAGAGKTTFCCYYASEISTIQSENIHQEFEDGSIKNNGPIILINLEMSEVQIKKLSKRIPNLNNLLIFNPQDNYDYIDWLDKFAELKPSLIILDSIQKLAELIIYSEHNSISRRSFQRHQKEIAIIFNKFSKLSYIPTILIGHTNKAGKYLGPSGLKHELDSHLEVIKDLDTGERKIKMDKNRWGGENPEVIMKFDGNSINFENNLMDFINIDKIQNEDTDDDKNIILINETFNFLLKNEEQLINKNNFSAITLNIVKTRSIKNYVIEGTDKKGIIEIGIKKINLLDENSWSKYPDENRYMNLCCKTSDDKLKWVVTREFCNILYSGNKKSLEFFQFVYKIYKQNF